ncbi:bifunctional protein-serine/threonine kinase/phosphatase [Shewanella pealeana]|uniref:Serine/threonine protein kinase n=1 Tax=Shewanella pealeana (strain ATCC 700345 / ANG-SQ1) TaxID=398579 RepID=A8H3K0_SHEPA|nr:bifunctional protein-serine/threonine kinase/phosphatase [Shewanella pealeana]ABV87137.1 serine/threonine protein kinase [Shewanella pealeana ATCC 700345]
MSTIQPFDEQQIASVGTSVLALCVGQHTDKGRKPLNEDAIGSRIPNGHLLSTKGAVVAMSDGVSLAEQGAAASAISVSNFLADYYSTPDLWSVKQSSQKVLTALNRWLYGLGQDYRDARRGYVCTFSALIFKSCHVHQLHLGDGRIYRYRNHGLQKLTTDHTSVVANRSKYLTRALGLGINIDVDYAVSETESGDIYLLTTDGVHDVLSDDIFAERLKRLADNKEITDKQCQLLTQELINDAIAKGSTDNVSCQCIAVRALPEPSIDDIYRSLTQLPFLPPLAVGMKLDGYIVLDTLYQSQRSQVYLVKDSHEQRYCLKTPSLNYQDDLAYIERFLLESWVGSRIKNPNVVAVCERKANKSAMYYLTEYIDGVTLTEWMRLNPKPEIQQVLRILSQVVVGLRAFHRKETLHQDVKPDNILIDKNGQVKIVDFGACFIKGIAEISTPFIRDIPLGTADYSAPETLLRYPVNAKADLYSLATIAYEMLTGELPFNGKQAQCKIDKDFKKLNYTPSFVCNPLAPIWMDNAIRKGLNFDASMRQADISEWMHEMNSPVEYWYRPAEKKTLITRDPLVFWQGLTAILGLIIILILLFLPSS